MIPSGDYRVRAKLYNNRLLEAIERRYPGKTVKEVAEAIGVHWGPLAGYRTMRKSAQTKAGEWRQPALRIAEALQLPVEYLFDPELYGRRPQEVEVVVDASQILAEGPAARALPPDVRVEAAERDAIVRRTLSFLDPVQQDVLAQRFGLRDGVERTLQEVADAKGVTREWVRKIEAKALQRLRHPRWRPRLREVWD